MSDLAGNFAWLISRVRLAPRYLLGVSLATAFLLFTTEPVLTVLGLAELRTQFRPWIGLVFIASTTLLLTQFAAAIWQSIRKKVTGQATLQQAQKRLHDLTPLEKGILRYFIQNNTRTQNFLPGDGVVLSLSSADILHLPSIDPAHSKVDGQPHIITDWAWDYLRAHPELIFDNTTSVPGIGNSKGA